VQTLRTYVLLLPVLMGITLVGLAIQVTCLISIGRGREFCRKYLLRPLCLCIFTLFGIKIHIKGRENIPEGQVIYIGNHSSTLDMPAICALSLPRTRYFLSKYTYKFLPITLVASALGTFYLDLQNKPKKRSETFKRASSILKESGDSVFLTPEGMRVTSGEIGHFNKGAFHLAAELRVPLVPIFFYIPKAMDPGIGINTGSGNIVLHFLPAIDTSHWKAENVEEIKEEVRQILIDCHSEYHQTQVAI
jgi:1-acyl-sn-glycerol-3-phosphate acyltransferase